MKNGMVNAVIVNVSRDGSADASIVLSAERRGLGRYVIVYPAHHCPPVQKEFGADFGQPDLSDRELKVNDSILLRRHNAHPEVASEWCFENEPLTLSVVTKPVVEKPKKVSYAEKLQCRRQEQGYIAWASRMEGKQVSIAS